MEVRPTADQEAFIRQALEAGRITHPQDAVVQAMALWEDRERKRIEILARIDAAELAVAHGGAIAITQESMAALALDVKSRGRARLEREGAERR